MELSPPLPLLLAALLLLLSASLTQAQIDVQSLDLPSTISVDNGDFAIFNDDEHDANLTSETNRRPLYWTATRHYYISYDALSANRIPCPMRFGSFAGSLAVMEAALLCGGVWDLGGWLPRPFSMIRAIWRRSRGPIMCEIHDIADLVALPSSSSERLASLWQWLRFLLPFAPPSASGFSAGLFVGRDRSTLNGNGFRWLTMLVAVFWDLLSSPLVLHFAPSLAGHIVGCFRFYGLTARNVFVV